VTHKKGSYGKKRKTRKGPNGLLDWGRNRVVTQEGPYELGNQGLAFWRKQGKEKRGGEVAEDILSGLLICRRTAFHLPQRGIEARGERFCEGKKKNVKGGRKKKGEIRSIFFTTNLIYMFWSGDRCLGTSEMVFCRQL